MSSSSDESSSSSDEESRARKLLTQDDNIQPMPELFPGMKWSSQERREMFENLFGSLNYGTETTSQPADTKECLEVLKVCTSVEKATERHDEIRRGCRGMISHHPSALLGIKTPKHEEGNKLFAAGRYEEALKKYKSMSKESPYDQRFYSNSALCYIHLGKYEKAIITSAYSVYIVGESWAKGHLAYATAYCHLGYVAYARDYIKKHAKLFEGADRKAAVAKIEEVAKGLQMRPKALDNGDLKATIDRLLSPNVNEKSLTFLLIHLVNHFHTSSGFCTGILLPAIVKSMDRCQVLNNLLKTKLDFDKISFSQSLILYLFEYLLLLFAMCCPSCSEELVKHSVLISYMAETGKMIATKSGMKAALKKQQFGQCIVVNYSFFLAALGSHDSVRSTFFQKSHPFNDFIWHANFIAATFCIMDVNERVIDMLTHLSTDEPWFFQRLERLTSASQKNELSCALAYLASISRFEFNAHDTVGSMLNFWMKVTSDRRTGLLAALRPGIWTHCVRRLEIYCELLKTKAKLGTDVELALKIMDNMLTTLRKSEPMKKEIVPLTVPEVDNIKILATSLVFLVNCKRNCPKLSQTSVVSVRTDALKMIARFAASSLQFRQAVYGTSFSLADIVGACTSDELSRIPGSAVYCLATFLRLSKNLNSVYGELAEMPTLPDLVTRLVSFITNMNETDVFSNACLALSYLLAMKERVKKRVLKVLAFDTAEETKRATALSSKLVNVIVTDNSRAPPRSKSMPLSPSVSSLSAGILLASLLTSDKSYRRPVRKAETEKEERCTEALDRVIEVHERE